MKRKTGLVGLLTLVLSIPSSLIASKQLLKHKYKYKYNNYNYKSSPRVIHGAQSKSSLKERIF